MDLPSFTFPDEITYNGCLYRRMPNGLYQRVLGGLLFACEHGITRLDVMGEEIMPVGNA